MNNSKDKRSYKNCCCAGCLNTTFKSDLTFFSLPCDKARRTIWLKILLREDLEDSNSLHFRVCEKHFDNESILETPTRKVLKRNALPTRLLPKPSEVGPSRANMSVTEVCSKCKALPKALLPQLPQTPSDDNPRKRNIESAMPDSKKKKREVELLSLLCDQFLSNKLAKLVKEQTRAKVTDFRNRHTIEYKIFCLNLFLVSPEAYNLLGDTLCLPRPTSLMRMCLPITIQPNHIMDALKIKVARMTRSEKNCCLLIDAIKLQANLFYVAKEDKIYGFHHEDQVQPLGPAEYGLVAVVQGLFSDYQQPVGYTMLAADSGDKRVTQWTDNLIHQLGKVGLNVRVFIPGTSYQFLNSAKTRIVSITSPYFFVNNRKIYYMFDPTQLIIQMRDSLMNYDFHFNSSVAKWDDIRQFYEKDTANQLRIAPKLTQSHVDPSDAEKTQAHLAVQVFGAPVATGMAAYVNLGGLDVSAEGTISLITKMNDLVQFFNLSSRYDCPSHRNDFCDQVHKVYFINSMLSFFATLKLIDEKNGIDVTSIVAFIESFEITLRSILHLYQDFKMDSYTYILTRKLSTDYIEKIFDNVKTKNENSLEPTSWQLVTEFRKSYLAVFFKRRKQDEQLIDDSLNSLFDTQKVKQCKNNKPSNTTAKNKEGTGSLSHIVNRKQQDLHGINVPRDCQTVDYVDNNLAYTVKSEQEMEVEDEDDLIHQIKKEQEDFLNMDFEIEEHEITVSSRQQEQNNGFSLIKEEEVDSLIRHYSPEQEGRDEESNMTNQIKQEQEDILNVSFEVEGNELIISSREQEHNYGPTFIKQKPDNVIRKDSSSLLDSNAMLHNLNKQVTKNKESKDSTSEEQSVSNSLHSIIQEQEDMFAEDSAEETQENDCLTHRIKQESVDILTMFLSIEKKNKRESFQSCKEPICATDYSTLNLPPKNALIYISGWLLQKCLFWHRDCIDFNAYIEFDLAHNPNETEYSRYKDYCKSGENNLRVIPPYDFVKYVEKMDEIFCELFKSPQIHSCTILGRLLETVKKIGFVMPCRCFPIHYARQLFFRIRLHYTLEYNNHQYPNRRTFSVPKL